MHQRRVDLRPLWEGAAAAVRDSLFLSMGKTQRAVTDGRWKLCVYLRVEHREIFDLESDPNETIDLAANPGFPHQVARLEREPHTWRRVTGDDDPLVAVETRPLFVDLTDAKHKPNRWQPLRIRVKYFPPPEETPAEGEGAASTAGAGSGR